MEETQKRTLCFAVRSLNNLVNRFMEKGTESINRAYNITPMHGFIIGFLSHNKDRNIYQKDIEQKLSIRSSTVTSMLKLMEKNGLLTRESVEEDARLKKIVLTRKAYDMQKETSQAMQSIDDELTSALTTEELDTFFGIINKIKDKIQDAHNTNASNAT
ncbi:MAG: MarR family transcriptional regulator [Eubacteriaceae bacterium]|nr:MarR family transcriptional regulator [Eubacteriaceae bacterium]